MDNGVSNKINMSAYLYKSLHMLLDNKIPLPMDASVYIYHHLGKADFEKIGGIFINIVNKEYRKSYVIELPGQRFPSHYHKIKQESFYVLCGTLDVVIEGEKKQISEGGIVNIERGQMHSFCTENGAIFEEISTTYTVNDSFFEDLSLNSVAYNDRRTVFNQEEWKEIYKLWKK